MSGGVDSAVALLRAGPRAVGVTLRLWIDPEGSDVERACCSPEAVIAARATCHGLGIPHVTIDAREEFRQAIVEPFVRGYRRGETPNPCIRCNGFFRFGRLLRFARHAGAARLATGHYARIVEHDGRLLLARAADSEKDQSYMLARLDPRVLDRVSFPLGGQSKEETRAEAERAGLAAARRAESQEACFLGGDDYRAFLSRHGLKAEEGLVEDEGGQVLGTHDGFWRFTPGQRKGLGVCGRVAGVRASHRSGPQCRRRGCARILGAKAGSGGRSPLRRRGARRRQASVPVAGGSGPGGGEGARFRRGAGRARVRRCSRPGGRALRR